jgi:hypothetical protein
MPPPIDRRRPTNVRFMPATGPDAVIWGLTTAGRRFRPSDWAERLAGLTSQFGHDQRLAYSPLVRPLTLAGHTAVIVSHRLERLEPRFWAFLLRFADDNALVVSHVDLASTPVAALAPPAFTASEPREPV